MKESVKNFIEILILIILIIIGGIIGGTWGFFCSKIFPNITVAMIFAILGVFAIGYVLTEVFIWIRNRKK